MVKTLIMHQKENNVQEQLQSAYQHFHSTETALTKVINDILMAIDQQKVVLLVLLDLSADFNTVDHMLILKRLSNWMGIKRKCTEVVRVIPLRHISVCQSRRPNLKICTSQSWCAKRVIFRSISVQHLYHTPC